VTESPWRYPGGKRRLAPALAQFTDLRLGMPWVEPFVGGGGFLSLVGGGRRMTIADFDPRVAAWWALVADPDGEEFDQLLFMLAETLPTVDLHTQLQSITEAPRLTLAYTGIVLNRISFSAVPDAGPIGGKEQTSRYGVGCRFNSDRLIAQHRDVRRAVYGARVLHADFEKTLRSKGLAVCDPPYVKAGSQLYTHAFGAEDHRRLARALLDRDQPFVLTYDDHEVVRELYRECTITEIPARYSICGVKVGWDRKTELVITNG